MGSLDGLHALVTGGGTGIGKGCVRELVREGAVVTITGRRADVLDAAAAELRAEVGGEIRIAPGDVTDEAAVADAVATASNGGRLDIAVANAGIGGAVPILASDPERYRKMLDINMVGVFLTIKHGGLAMREHGGSIIAISSIAAAVRGRFRSLYASTKAGVDALCDSAADELGGFGIRVNTVRPGLVESELTGAVTNPGNPILADYERCAPLGRIATPEEVGRTVVYLAGPDSVMVSGQHIAVDGGHTLRRAPDYELGMRARYKDEYADYVALGSGPMGDHWDGLLR